MKHRDGRARRRGTRWKGRARPSPILSRACLEALASGSIPAPFCPRISHRIIKSRRGGVANSERRLPGSFAARGYQKQQSSSSRPGPRLQKTPPAAAAPAAAAAPGMATGGEAGPTLKGLLSIAGAGRTSSSLGPGKRRTRHRVAATRSPAGHRPSPPALPRLGWTPLT